MIYKTLFIAATLLASAKNSAAVTEQAFDDILACRTEISQPGIAVRIEQAGELIYQNARGMADIKNQIPLSVKDSFQIGSVSKQFTAAAILLLADQKKLALSDQIGQYLPELRRDYQQATIAQVLSHTAGIPNYNEDGQVRDVWHQYATLDAIIPLITRLKMTAKPGQEYRYSNTGYLLLGKIIEIASGLSYAEYMQQAIFAPLNMKHTYVLTKGTGANKVQGYDGNPQTGFRMPQTVDRSWIHAAGAIVSTLEDMSRWHQGLSSGQLLSKTAFANMVAPAVLNSGQTINYGFGMDIFPIHGEHSYSHQGGVPGFMSWMVYFPEHQLFAMAFSNHSSNHPGPALLDLIARQLALSPSPISGPVSPETAQQFTGTYRTHHGDQLQVSYANQTLFAQQNSDEKQPLQLREQQSFSYSCREDYFSLLDQGPGKPKLQPVHIYHGKGAVYQKQ